MAKKRMYSSIAEAFRKSTWFFRGEKFLSRRSIFRALNFTSKPDQACKKVGAQNQITRPIETQLETLHFAL